MALVINDRVRETTTVTGTGSATLLGAVTGYQSFSVIGNGNTTYYTIADQGGPNWEVGLGTYSSGTLARTTVLSSSNSGSLVNFTAGTKDVFVTYPSEKAVYFDLNGNITTNCLFEGYTSQSASGTTIVLTASSPQNWAISGSGGQTIKLPDATTLPSGATFTFNNNQSSGTIVIQNNSSTTIATVQSGAYITVVLLSNSISAGSWDYHNSPPSNASWSTNTLSWAGSYTNGTWNGNVIGTLYGGTGLNSLTAGRIPYGAGTSAFGNSANLFFDSTNTRLGVGSATPAVTAVFVGTDALLLPKGGTSAQPTGVAGYLRFNTDTSQFEGYNGTTWSSVGGAAISNDTSTASFEYPVFASATSGTALTIYTSNAKYLYQPSTGELQAYEINATNGLLLNNATVSASYTIASGTNALSVGPVTVASGQSVTVPSGSRWVVL
jgi:hypothetical protein